MRVVLILKKFYLQEECCQSGKVYFYLLTESFLYKTWNCDEYLH